MTPQRIIEAAKASTTDRTTLQRLDCLDWAPEYAEPGYSNPKRGGIWFGNWNDGGNYGDPSRDTTMSRVAELLEKYGASIEWEDEWSTCSDCGKAIRTQPDSYGWLPSYFMGDGEIICIECVRADPETYTAQLEDQPTRAWTLPIDPAEHGHRLLEDGFESGWHPGQDDNPQEITDRLHAQGIGSGILFVVDRKGQFDLNFSVYVRIQDGEDIG